MKSIKLIFSLFVILLFVGIVQAANLDSVIGKVDGMSLTGKSELQILNELSTKGELDTSVPKRIISSSEGQTTIFVFELGSDHESAFNEILNSFKDEGYSVVKEKTIGDTKGIELDDGESKLQFIKKNEILIEYKLEPILESAVSEETSKLPSVSGGWWKWLVGILVVVVILGFLLYKKFKKFLK